MNKHIKKLSEEIVFENDWWKCKHETYEKPRNGGIGHYYYAESNGAVMIVPVLKDGRIVMIIQRRYLMDRQSIEFPCGGIKPSMSILDNAKRELFEETGCVANDFINIGSFEPSNGFIKDLVHVYIANVDGQKEQQLDNTEEIEIIYRHPYEIEEMAERGDIWDGQTLAAWCVARRSLLKKIE